ncbi:MAG: glycosyltransferase family 4 protein [Rhodothermales bacterium]
MNQSRPVFYFTRMLPAYRLPIIERLNERLDNRLVVFHGQPPNGNPVLMDEQKGTFKQSILKNYWYKDTTVHAQPFKKAFRDFGPPSVVLAEESPRSVTLPFLLRKAKKLGAGRVLWGIFYSVHRPFSGNHPLQRYRINMARGVEACACYSRQSKAYLQPFVDDKKLFVAQNAMDTNTLSSLRIKLEQEGKQAVRKRLGLPENQPTFVFVAQLVKRKGTEELLNIFHEIRSKQPATLLVIGGGPEKANMEQQIKKLDLQDVHMLGPISALDASAPYMYAADLMLLPGYVGLVVNHAFSLGLPVITQAAPGNLPFHGPEVESIVDGENGIIVPRDNQEAMIHAIQTVLADSAQYAQRAVTYAEQNLSLDHMVDGLIGAINLAAKSAGQ